jgi:hypothetical protein
MPSVTDIVKPAGPDFHQNFARARHRRWPVFAVLQFVEAAVAGQHYGPHFAWNCHYCSEFFIATMVCNAKLRVTKFLRSMRRWWMPWLKTG